MAVFTEVSADEARKLMRQLRLGELLELRGIAGGIENTNYFATTWQEGDADTPGRQAEFVLTLFERLTAEQLPFYLYLMQHLAARGIPVPDPAPDRTGNVLHQLCGKPAAVVNRLRGASELKPGTAHCRALGGMLARMHLAGRDFSRSQPNLRGLAWWNEVVPSVLPHLEPAQATLLRSELAYQNHVAASPDYTALPRGPVHADLFRDNAMFDGETLTGFFDFYFAGWDSFAFDLAVCLNDWCIDWATGLQDDARADVLLQAYAAVRPLEPAERALMPAMLRAAALRFWISRLWDFHLPRHAELLTPHDPTHFERVLRGRVDALCAA
ncbi:homoserine kinase [Xylophilus ampelinus]|uniref:Homoserine kinase n=1 Tax=Xylophilus ampelinus TaxID=54067 RepID=A0A318SD09_9BURK|nr:homoserine kinase [Xylophilus ampelinus]MCS4511357.1 homoserine kinase [Xylophilus ampelinus]PYE74887.1 homoserine kinase [Xylophilus ampelinus]